MLKFLSVYCLVLILGFCQIALSQTTHIITIANSSYTPKEISIASGDTIDFQWVSGTHPTVSDQSLWSTFTLNASNSNKKIKIDTVPGDYTYYCSIHGNPNGYPSGMTGKITVNGPANPVPTVHPKHFTYYIYNKQLHIESKNIAAFTEIRILSMDGALVKTNLSQSSKNIDLDLSTLASGVYLLQYTSSLGEQSANKFFLP